MENNSEKSKLKDRCFKAIRTTMIGSIDIIEKEFAEELENDEEFQKAFYSMREKILDLGNDQIHYLDMFFNKFNVEQKSNNYQFFKKERRNGN